MAKNYLTYPLKTMKISQSYTGSYSHDPHSKGTPKDYPWDECGADRGREYFYCPCDKMVVKKVYGVGNGGTNTIWLESSSKVDFADGTQDYLTILVTHPNDDDLKKISTGKTYTRGQAICREGTDGNATGNHFHFSAGKGKMSGGGWIQNSKKAWVLTTTGGTFKPEQLFYIDTTFTTKILDKKGLGFKNKPKETATTTTTTTYTTGNYKVNTDVLKVRSGAGTSYAAVPFNKLTTGAQKKILTLTGNIKKDGYVKGLTFTVTQVKTANNYHWGKTPSGWVALEYCKKV